MKSDTQPGSSEAAIAAIRADYESRYGAPRTELIEAGRVRDYLLAMDELAEIGEGDAVPPLFLLTLGRTRRPQPSRGGAVNGGDEYEFYYPVRVGDRITISRRLVRIEEKQGKRGRMFVTRAESTFHNQDGKVVALAHQNIIRWGW